MLAWMASVLKDVLTNFQGSLVLLYVVLLASAQVDVSTTDAKATTEVASGSSGGAASVARKLTLSFALPCATDVRWLERGHLLNAVDLKITPTVGELPANESWTYTVGSANPLPVISTELGQWSLTVEERQIGAAGILAGRQIIATATFEFIEKSLDVFPLSVGVLIEAETPPLPPGVPSAAKTLWDHMAAHYDSGKWQCTVADHDSANWLAGALWLHPAACVTSAPEDECQVSTFPALGVALGRKRCDLHYAGWVSAHDADLARFASSFPTAAGGARVGSTSFSIHGINVACDASELPPGSTIRFGMRLDVELTLSDDLGADDRPEVFVFGKFRPTRLGDAVN